MTWRTSIVWNVTRRFVPSHLNLTHDNHSLHTKPPLHNIATVNAFAATRPPDCLSSCLARNANTAHNNNLHTTYPANLRPTHRPFYAECSRANNATSGLLAKLMVMLHVASRKSADYLNRCRQIARFSHRRLRLRKANLPVVTLLISAVDKHPYGVGCGFL
jgi:hypothetical protein